MTPKNWKLTTYTVNTWTDVIAEQSILANVLVVNTDPANAITLSMRLSGGAIVLPAATIPPASSLPFDFRSLNIMASESLQMQAQAAGIHIIASGATP